jgi:hypothetical protein
MIASRTRATNGGLTAQQISSSTDSRNQRARRAYYLERDNVQRVITSSDEKFSGGTFVNRYQLFVIWERRNPASLHAVQQK